MKKLILMIALFSNIYSSDNDNSLKSILSPIGIALGSTFIGGVTGYLVGRLAYSQLTKNEESYETSREKKLLNNLSSKYPDIQKIFTNEKKDFLLAWTILGGKAGLSVGTVLAYETIIKKNEN
jgi:hypothetical protein